MSASSFQLLEQFVWHFFNMHFLQADDEHSDWPGPEPGLSVMQLTDEEIDPEISFSQVSWWRLRLNSMPVIAAPCWTSSQKVSRATSQIWHQETEVPGSCRSVCLVFFPLLVSSYDSYGNAFRRQWHGSPSSCIGVQRAGKLQAGIDLHCFDAKLGWVS